VPSLKEVRIRIDSIKSSEQITSAMKLVSASKLRRTQNAVQALAPYAAKLREILNNLSISLENTETAAYSAIRPVEKVLLIVVTSNRGLCGPFNSNIIRAAKSYIETTYSVVNRQGNLDVFAIGRKGADFFRKNKYNLVREEHAIFDRLKFENTTPLAEELMADYASARYDRIEIIYNHFKNASQQVITIDQYLPVVTGQAVKDPWQATDYIFEPEKKILVRELVPKVLKTHLYRIILDSYAAEHGARMTAMAQATDNAQELLKQLKLSYNKARQAAITKELLEIVSGAEALKG